MNRISARGGMELRHLRYFIAVAEELHFGRAARRLGIAQPPLSQQIRKLEEELSVRLFERTRRRVALTEAGGAFLREARLTLHQAERAARAAQQAGRGETGDLLVGATASADCNVLPVVLPAFRRQYPDVNVILRSLSAAEQIDALTHSRIDVGFLRLPVRYDDRLLTVRRVFREPMVLALPRRHPLASRPRVPLQKLAGVPYIFFPRSRSPEYHDSIVAACQKAGVTLNVVQEAEHTQTLLGLVSLGFGVALLPASLRAINRKGVVFRPVTPARLTVEMAVAHRKDNASMLLSEFVGVVDQVLKAAP